MTVQFVGVTEQGRMTRKAPAQPELRPTCTGVSRVASPASTSFAEQVSAYGFQPWVWSSDIGEGHFGMIHAEGG
jgi:hypothetical protein